MKYASISLVKQTWLLVPWRAYAHEQDKNFRQIVFKDYNVMRGVWVPFLNYLLKLAITYYI